jgi:hypothetical protein
VKHPNFGSHAYHLVLSRFVFDEFIAKGESMGTKLAQLLLTGWLREEI